MTCVQKSSKSNAIMIYIVCMLIVIIGIVGYILYNILSKDDKDDKDDDGTIKTIDVEDDSNYYLLKNIVNHDLTTITKEFFDSNYNRIIDGRFMNGFMYNSVSRNFLKNDEMLYKEKGEWKPLYIFNDDGSLVDYKSIVLVEGNDGYKIVARLGMDDGDTAGSLGCQMSIQLEGPGGQEPPENAVGKFETNQFQNADNSFGFGGYIIKGLTTIYYNTSFSYDDKKHSIIRNIPEDVFKQNTDTIMEFNYKFTQ
jgi:hypothetical protein